DALSPRCDLACDDTTLLGQAEVAKPLEHPAEDPAHVLLRGDLGAGDSPLRGCLGDRGVTHKLDPMSSLQQADCGRHQRLEVAARPTHGEYQYLLHRTHSGVIFIHISPPPLPR